MSTTFELAAGTSSSGSGVFQTLLSFFIEPQMSLAKGDRELAGRATLVGVGADSEELGSVGRALSTLGVDVQCVQNPNADAEDVETASCEGEVFVLVVAVAAPVALTSLLVHSLRRRKIEPVVLLLAGGQQRSHDHNTPSFDLTLPERGLCSRLLRIDLPRAGRRRAALRTLANLCIEKTAPDEWFDQSQVRVGAL